LKGLKKILRYIFPKYTGNTVLYFIFNILSTVFGLFSLLMVMPFLSVLFNKTELVTKLPDLAFSAASAKGYFNYYLSQIIIHYDVQKALLYVSLFFVVATLLKTLFFYLAKYYMVPVNSGIVRDIRERMYSKILRLSLSYFSDERKGDIISRMTNDVSEIELSVVQSVEAFLKEPVTIIAYLISLLVISPQLSLFVFVLFPISGLIIGKIGSSLRRKSVMAQNKLGDLLTKIEETLGGLRIIKAFNAEKKSEASFDKVNKEYTNLMIRLWRRRDLAVPMSEFLGVSIVVVVMWFGGSMVLSGKDGFSSEALITYLAIFSQIINPAKTFTNAFYNIQKGLAAIDRIDKILEADVTIKDAANARELPGLTSSISYNNIFFKYNNDFVINGISLKIEKGQTVALVGQSGSGKSTLVDLLPRFYDVTTGSITIDGVDIREFKVKSLRKMMGIVNQESILFNDTIFNNIAFGVEHATPDEVIAAAKIANAHDFIMETPNGYETNIGDRGGKLSGGQRQRISIARAILANPPVTILDEATSALDTESEKLVQESLTRLMENRTSIVIAHRLSTVIHADLICVVHEGKIVEQGTHHQLLAQGGYYKKLHDAQMFA